ncbi:MAG TPA: helix-turn-helix domain-containing protein [Candidatus Limnocylindrales bacterium]|nr:helix-turn-helix domain-containing protein [Candidatus Limnocylindrales bacterium]
MDDAIPRLRAIDAGVLERASRVIRVVGHPLRLRLLELLEGGERNVTDLVQTTGVGQAMVSQQLKILRAEGVVGDRREGPRVFYRITEPKVSRILDCIRECDLPDLPGPSDVAGGLDLRVLPSSSRPSGASRRERPTTG